MSDPSHRPLAAGRLPEFRGKIMVVGAGKMGSALLQGWLSLGVPAHRLAAIEPVPSDELKALAGRGLHLNAQLKAGDEVAAAVIAVKPQVAPEVIPQLLASVGPATVIVSIMAGRTLHFLGVSFPGRAVVRAMPNTPAAVGRGITVAVANPRVSNAQRALVHDLLSAVGAVEWVSDEGLMDAVTAVSGSGPAYVFLLAEAMASAGSAAGLPPALAHSLARATVAGSGELLHRSSLEPATLRQNVTSPGGTTAAALEVLMDKQGLQELMTRAVAAATKRSRELAG
jgi:pyrroline-5-carboxylate reductase